MPVRACGMQPFRFHGQAIELSKKCRDEIENGVVAGGGGWSNRRRLFQVHVGSRFDFLQ